MIKSIENPNNKDRIAIVVIGYNRKKALERLLSSIESAVYDTSDVPLVISIDASGDTNLYEFVNSYKWEKGDKYVNIQEKRLGLKQHIFQCISLSHYFKGVIILEDDLFVSPFFYHYAICALDKYGDDENVAGIALYNNEYDGFTGLPLLQLNVGFDVFAKQSVCSWGELFNERMWSNFSSWLNSFNGNFTDIEMIETIKTWDRAWSKYMYAYMVQSGSFFIYPNIPLTTNFNDAGGEHGGGDNTVQVSILQGFKNYFLGDFKELVHYDMYGDNLAISDWLGISAEDLIVDFNKQHTKYDKRFVLTPFKLPYKKIKSFRLSMRPWELNVKYNLYGDDIYLYDRNTKETVNAPKREYPNVFIHYYFGRYQQNISVRLLLRRYWNVLKSRIGL